MNKSTLLSLFVGAALSAPVLTQADTFSVSIAITDLQTALVLTETTKMKLPTLVIDGTKANGQTCYSYRDDVSLSTLCPGAVTGTDKNNATFSVVGTPLDVVSITFVDPAIKNGLQLDVSGAVNGVTLDASGAANFDTRAILSLRDISAVQPSTDFDYEVIVAYS